MRVGYLLFYSILFWVTFFPPVLEASRAGEVLLNQERVSLGDIGTGRLKKAQAIMTYATAAKRIWTIGLPSGWNCKPEEDFSGTITHRHPSRIQLAMKSSFAPMAANGHLQQQYNVQLHLEFENKHIVCQRYLPPGPHREGINFRIGGEEKNIEIFYNVLDYPSEPVLSVYPQRLDFGRLEPNQQTMRKIEITNRGRQPLKWRIEPISLTTEKVSDFVVGTYHSFFLPEASGTGAYRPAVARAALMEFSGHWGEMDGYPEAHEKAVLKYHYTGGGVIVYYWKSPAGKTMNVYLDNHPIGQVETYSDNFTPAEYRLPETTIRGAHTLMLVNQQGRVVLEGVKIPGKGLIRDQGKWLRIFPESGATNREVDYLHLAVDTKNLRPGVHGQYFQLSSNGGTQPLEIYVEVASEVAAKILDVYRYHKGDDLFFTTNPPGEARLANGGDYLKEGIAFRLYSPGTPGTTDFYRWYNQRAQRHYYSCELNADGKLNRDFVREGAIGNIATIRLVNSRPLYRWHHSGSGQYFFTTDPRGEGRTRKGYKYDGIVGYVR